jgi:hypothetical protein
MEKQSACWLTGEPERTANRRTGKWAFPTAGGVRMVRLVDQVVSVAYSLHGLL